MSAQPEALRLADRLETDKIGASLLDSAAAELRRLHALNAELLESLKSTADLLQVWIDGAPPYDEAKTDREVLAKARAAIAKAEGRAATQPDTGAQS